MKVSEIRTALVQSGKYTQEEVDNIKGKAKLIELHNAVYGETLLDNLEEDVEEVKLPVVDTPSYLSTEWPDYVLSQLTDGEKEGKHPLIHGLRRLVESLLGPIIFSSAKEFSLTGENPGHCSCLYEIKIKWIRDDEGNVYYGECGVRTFGALAGSYEGNTDGEFAVYPEAIAETRAEVRALRKALRLSVCAAEEMSNKAVETIKEKGRIVEWSENDKCDLIQSGFIKKKCDSLGISLDKLISTRGVDDVTKLTKEQAADLILYINKVQTNNEVLSDDLKI